MSAQSFRPMGAVKSLALFFGLASAHPGLPAFDLTPRDDTVPSYASAAPESDYEGDSFCNTADDRQCWLDGYDINTNYGVKYPQGVTREYWLEIDYADLAPDGYPRDQPMKVINGTYPGPLIEANWGDELVIHVTNKMSEPEGTTLHWHGVRQLHTTQQDGVVGVTQCPIAQDDTMTYTWRATQYGHSWYHSHHSLQYPEGILGPLLIHGPSSANWDQDLGVIAITDYFQKPTDILFLGELQDPPITATSNSTLINGHGIFPCNGTREDPSCGEDNNGSRFTTTVKKGKRYLLRLVNTSTVTQFRFAIDNHMLEVVQTDFVPIQPYKTPYVSIGIGQRYEVIVEMDPEYDAPFGAEPEEENFWIRTIPLDDCNTLEGSFPTYGILRYDSASTSDPTSEETEGIPTVCTDEPAANLVPVVPWQVGQSSEDVELKVGIDKEKTHGYYRWDITDTPMWVDYENPTILNLQNDSNYKPEWAVISDEHYSDTDWVYFIIQGAFAENPNKTSLSAAHPIHLHGHDFAILAQGTGNWTADVQLNLDNPARRDVALLDSLGYLVIAFKSDNPGIWLMHCHIAWHASSGLALQVVERVNDIPATITDKDEIEENCEKWESFASRARTDREDSGV